MVYHCRCDLLYVLYLKSVLEKCSSVVYYVWYNVNSSRHYRDYFLLLEFVRLVVLMSVRIYQIFLLRVFL